ncbi:MAG: hypothetical protein Q8Q09_01530 [Deltaproteobacteria bacterium]|nr:hypothetical protein [Deltaproteobacteria bacterium]
MRRCACFGFVLALLATAGCGPRLACGEGTVERDGRCVVAGLDGSVEMDAQRDGMASGDGASADVRDDAPRVTIDDVDRLSDFRFQVRGSVPRDSRGGVLPVGAMMQLVGAGVYEGRGFWVPLARVAVGVDNGVVSLSLRDGELYVTALREGTAVIRGEIDSAAGARVIEYPLTVRGTMRGTLQSLAITMGTTTGGVFDAGRVPTLSAFALDSPTQIVTLLRFVSASDTGANPPSAGYTLLASSDLAYEVTAGSGTVDAAGTVRASAVGTVQLSVRYRPRAITLTEPMTTTSARFVGEATQTGTLVVGDFLQSSPTDGAQGALVSGASQSADSADPADQYPSPNLGGILLGTWLIRPVVLRVARVHGVGEDRYLRWVLPGQYRTRSSGDPRAFTLDTAGVLRSGATGVALLTVTSGTHEAPIMLRSVDERAPPMLRAEPAMFTLAAPRGVGVRNCGNALRMFVTMPGMAERPFSPVEILALRLSADFSDAYASELIPSGVSNGAHYCTPTVRFGTTHPSMGRLQAYLLGGMVNVPYVVTAD